jgi:dienelactone hydrolase
MVKRILIIGVVAIIALLGAGMVTLRVNLSHAHAHYFDQYDPSLPLNAEVVERTPKDGYILEKVYFESRPGEKVPTFFTFPPDATGKLPLIVFLHGIGQNKDFIEEITLPFNQNGFAMATFDQSTRGERKLPKDKGAWEEVKAFFDRPWKTVNDARRLLDYCMTRDDIDMQRIYLVGASYGAITGSTFAAFDQRVKAAALVYGAGNIEQMLDARMINAEVATQYPQLEPLLPYVRSFAAYVLDPADPIHYVDNISPRPVLFQNGRDDGLIATVAAEALQAKAGEPKTILWYEGDHIGLHRPTVARVLQDGLEWLLKQDAEFRGGNAQMAQITVDTFAELAKPQPGDIDPSTLPGAKKQ